MAVAVQQDRVFLRLELEDKPARLFLIDEILLQQHRALRLNQLSVIGKNFERFAKRGARHAEAFA